MILPRATGCPPMLLHLRLSLLFLLLLSAPLRANETADERVATPVGAIASPAPVVPPPPDSRPVTSDPTTTPRPPSANTPEPSTTPSPSPRATPLPEPLPVATVDAPPSESPTGFPVPPTSPTPRPTTTPRPAPSLTPVPPPAVTQSPSSSPAATTGAPGAETRLPGTVSGEVPPEPTPIHALTDPDTSAVVAPTPEPVLPFTLLDTEVPPGNRRRLSWYASDSFTGLAEPTPVLIAHGSRPGPVLCLTAAIHGDEVNGIEMVRRVLYGIDPEELTGTVIGVPIVNLQGYRQGSRYLPDRRDLNRHFPGHARGSAAARIAHSLFNGIIRRCDALVDLHTGSFHRTNLPQVRGDLGIDSVVHLTKGFGATAVLSSQGPPGSLRRAATDIGIPAITLEAGEPMRFQSEEVDHGVRALRSLLNHLKMVPRFRLWGEPQPIYYESVWLRVNDGGILTSLVPLGARVIKDQVLGEVTDPITNRRNEIRAPFDGRVLGMALNQSVIPGFAAYHVGIQRSEEELATADPAESTESDAAADDTEQSDLAPPDMEVAPETDAPPADVGDSALSDEEERPD